MKYIVKNYNQKYGEQDFASLESDEHLNTWLEDGSLEEGDEIYEVKKLFTVKLKKELILVSEK